MSRKSCGSSSAVTMRTFLAVMFVSILLCLFLYCLPGCWRRHAWQQDVKCASLCECTLHPEHTSMPGDNGFAERQAQPQAIHLAGETRIYPVKPLENPREVFWSNASAVITNLDLDQRLMFAKRSGQNKRLLTIGVQVRRQC